MKSGLKILIAILIVYAVLSVFRAYHLYVTSFFVSDEYRYTRDALSGTSVDYTVATRFVFTAMNAGLFALLHIQTVDAFVVFLPFYLFAWIAVSMLFFYKMMRLLDFSEGTISLSLVSSLVLVSFTLLSLGFLSESFALAMATVGTFLLVWYVKKAQKGMRHLMAPVGAFLFFTLASFSREPYHLFLVGGTIIAIIAGISKARSFAFPIVLAGTSFLTINVIYLFTAGLMLGWGPIALTFAAAGTGVLLAKALRDPSFAPLLLVCLIAFGSYLSVAVLVANGVGFIGDYFSFQHFSTLIRFTDTAIPGFFLAAPFAFSFVAKRKKLVYASLLMFLLFGIGAARVYQSYASSNLGLQQNPFSFEYRSGGAMVRDYIVTHPSAAPFHVLGFWTATWYETTGTSQIDNRSLDFWMKISEDEFVNHRWTTFYTYGYNLMYPNQTLHAVYYGTASPLLMSIIYPNSKLVSHPALPFDVMDRTMLGNATAFLIKFDVVWKS